MTVDTGLETPSPAVARKIAAIASAATAFETAQAGSRMVWRRWGTGSPVLLLHGGSGSWKHWIRNIPALAAEHTVWVPDLPGFGESGAPQEPISLGSVASQVVSGLRELSPETRTFDLAGFSLGGAFATQIASQFTGLVRNLVLIGSNFAGAPELALPGLVSLRGLDGAAQRLQAYRNNLRVLMLARDESVDDLALFIYALDAARRRIPGKTFRGNGGMSRLLPEVRCGGTILAICGGADATLTAVAARQEAALATLRPDASYVEIAEGGHWVMYEEPERVDRLLKSVFSV